MFGLRKTLGSIFLAVFFLALAYTAMVFYNADKSQQETIINNDLVQKGKTALIAVADVTEKLGTTPPARNVQLEKNVTDSITKTDWLGFIGRLAATSSAVETDSSVSGEASSSLWTKVTAWAKDEWDNSLSATSSETYSEIPELQLPIPVPGQPINVQNAEAVLDQKFINYEKTDTGAEIIFRPETGKEYKLPLPFKFLSN